MLEPSMNAPDFCLPGLSGIGEEKVYCLADILSLKKQLVLYFYPKDNTSGCTKEACDFRDNFNRLTNKAIVIGISPDSVNYIKF